MKRWTVMAHRSELYLLRRNDTYLVVKNRKKLYRGKSRENAYHIYDRN